MTEHPSTSTQANGSTAYFPWFDWLRVILALTVASSHVGLVAWSHAGNLAVQIFFALSGWLIGGILLDTPSAGLARFYFNRATRIWIPYVAAIVLLLSTSALKDTYSVKYWEFVFYKLTFVYNLFGPPQLHLADQMPLQGTGNHFWSICAEEQFYLLAPLLLVVVPHRIGRSLALWVSLSVLACIFDVYGAITLGVLAALAHRSFGSWHRHPAAQAVLLVLATACGVAFIAEQPKYESIAPVFSVCLVLLAAREGAKSRIEALVGGISYPFYLNHWIGIFVASSLFKRFGVPGSTLYMVTAMFLSIAVCTMMYLLIDQQVMRRRGAWFTARRGWSLAAAGFTLVAVGVVGGMILTHSSAVDVSIHATSPGRIRATSPATHAKP